jgi:phage baseplate assembly protein W
MRPDFGCGLLELVFEPGGGPLVATTQHLVLGALEQFLGHVIAAQSVEVDQVEGTLTVRVDYVVLRTREPATAMFSRVVA